MSINANVGSCGVKQEEIDFKESFFQNNNQNNKLGVSIAERRAATRGFDASNINSAWFKSNAVGEGGVQSQTVRSPYFTIPPGISPSELLDSPIMLPNAQAQLSPTTGTFQFSPNHENLKLKLKLSYTATMESSSEPNAQVFPHSVSKNLKVENEQYGELKYPSDLQEMANNNCFIDGLAFSGIGVKSWSETESQSRMQPIRNQIFNQSEQTGKDRTMTPNRDKKGPSFPKEVAKYSEDGYYWRKYGQKQVKGSEYPRSYFKCTNTNCLVKKKVERSHDGQITEIEYKGSHNHPKPQPLKRFGDTSEINDGSSSKDEVMIENQDVITFGSDWKIDGQDGISSSSFPSDFSDPFSKKMNIENQELSSTFHSSENRDGADQASPESISFNNDYDESEPKRRKRESCPNETSTISRSTREPRVVLQIESEIDILDDGYRWRKYGQKVVKGNPNPRSYYKCTTPGCPVRKHVERAADDIKSVITTYEGKHNHEVPCSKNGTLVISDVANLPRDITNSTAQKHAHMQNKSGKRAQDHIPLFAERKPFLNYNEFIRSNMHSNFPADLNFGASSIYPLPFPPLPSIPYTSLFLNGNNHMKNFPSSNVYPMLPDYMTLQSPMNHVLGSGNVPFGGGNFQVNNYHQAVQCQSKTVKPKEEQRDEVGMYNACLSIPNHGNRTI